MANQSCFVTVDFGLGDFEPMGHISLFSRVFDIAERIKAVRNMAQQGVGQPASLMYYLGYMVPNGDIVLLPSHFTLDRVIATIVRVRGPLMGGLNGYGPCLNGLGLINTLAVCRLLNQLQDTTISEAKAKVGIILRAANHSDAPPPG